MAAISTAGQGSARCADGSGNATPIGAIANPVDRFFAFLQERHAIYLRRAAGEPPPWTDEPILQEWNFCNVYRELDKTTAWIRKNWREPFSSDPDLWFAMVVARFVNWPETLSEIGYPVPWNPDHFIAVMAARKARGAKLYGDAYMIRADQAHAEKATYQVECVFDPLWRARERVRPRPGDRLRDFFDRLSPFHGMGGGFMPAQVVADLKYVEPLRSASDWDTFAASGPGSRRGLNRVLGRPVEKKWREDDWRIALRNLRERMRPMFEAAGMEVPHAQDFQSCACEVDKFERERLGQGHPKRRFRSAPKRPATGKTARTPPSPALSLSSATATTFESDQAAEMPSQPVPQPSPQDEAHDAATATEIKPATPPTEIETAARLFALFGGARANRYRPSMTKPDEDGKVLPVEVDRWCGPPTVPLWDEHLHGEIVLGVIADEALFGTADVDDYQEDEVDLGEVVDNIYRWKLPVMPTRSKSGGLHLTIFTTEWVAPEARERALRAMAARLGLRLKESGGRTEIITTANIWLPYSGGSQSQRCGVKQSGFEMTPGEFLRAAEAARLTPAAVAELASAPPPAPSMRSGSNGAGHKFNTADGRAWLARRCKKLAAMRDGDGRDKLVNDICLVGGKWLEAGLLDDDVFKRELTAACIACGYSSEKLAEKLKRVVAKGRKLGPPETGARQNGKAPPVKSYELVCAASVIMRPKQWLWKGHLLRGALELLAGIPGLGKSQVQCHYVACVTTRLPWPDGTPSGDPAPVIMLTAEDALDQDVVPRLVAAGADVNLVHILKCIKTDEKKRQFLLGEDLDELEKAVARTGNVGLITMDPITAYMGGKMDSHKATEVRSQLGPLKDFAERVNVATSAVTHPPKSASKKAIDHFIGSQAFIAAARLGHVCVEETETDEDGEQIKTGRVLYTNPKNNPHVKMPTLAYRVGEIAVGRDDKTGEVIAAARVIWDREAVDISADEAVGGGSGQDKAIVKFLKAAVANGPVPSATIYQQGKAKGFSEDQLKRAKLKLKLDHRKDGMRGGWLWHQPGDSRGTQEEMKLDGKV